MVPRLQTFTSDGRVSAERCLGSSIDGYGVAVAVQLGPGSGAGDLQGSNRRCGYVVAIAGHAGDQEACGPEPDRQLPQRIPLHHVAHTASGVEWRSDLADSRGQGDARLSSTGQELSGVWVLRGVGSEASRRRGGPNDR